MMKAPLVAVILSLFMPIMFIFVDALSSVNRPINKGNLYLKREKPSFGKKKYKTCKSDMKPMDTWQEPVGGVKDLCWFCTCYEEGKSKGATCEALRLWCAPTNCKRPVRIEGHCCKTCKKRNKKKPKEGEWFTIPPTTEGPTDPPFQFPFRDADGDHLDN